MDCFLCHKESSRLTTFPQGRNYNRSLKAHTILSTALKMILIKQLGQGIVAEVSNVCRSVINDSSASLDIDALRAYPVANEQMEQIRDLESEISKSPLFTLWIQYINIIDIVDLNIYAEVRTYWLMRIQYTWSKSSGEQDTEQHGWCCGWRQVQMESSVLHKCLLSQALCPCLREKES